MIKDGKIIIGLIFLALAGGLLLYWQMQQDPKEPTEQRPTAVPEETVGEWERGEVTYIDLEGGFYGIITEQGQKLDPTNLPEEYKEDGLEIRFQAEEKEGAFGIRMWGTIVEIADIKRLEE